MKDVRITLSETTKRSNKSKDGTKDYGDVMEQVTISATLNGPEEIAAAKIELSDKLFQARIAQAKAIKEKKSSGGMKKAEPFSDDPF